jgi:hypothetical protein
MLTVSVNTKAVKAMLDKVKRAAPAVVAEAMNHTANSARVAIRREMERAFDRPTKYTLDSLYVDKASATKLQAKLWFKRLEAKSGGSGRYAHYLIPQIFGGRRDFKQFERLLRTKGVLPHGLYAVPGEAAEMDANGNMRPQQIRQIISWMQADQETGYAANLTEASRKKWVKTTKRRRGFAFFAVNGQDKRTRHLRPGIYKRTATAWGWALQPILAFVRMPRYAKRLRFFEVGQAEIERKFPSAFEKAWNQRVK